jgi:nitroimidazol reductase NimA-like FMN-containing flavoprotein (pyridoxamine 5'-phosphate oxidase superfamily)
MTKPGGPAAKRRIEVLAPDQCWRLLEAGRVGRVVFVDARGPVALPVNYRVFDRDIVFRTAPDSSVLASSSAGRVSFQIDDIDEHHRVGWSVLATGRVERASGATEVRAVEGLGVDPWAEGRTEYLRLVVGVVTGRRLAVVDG